MNNEMIMYMLQISDVNVRFNYLYITESRHVYLIKIFHYKIVRGCCNNSSFRVFVTKNPSSRTSVSFFLEIFDLSASHVWTMSNDSSDSSVTNSYVPPPALFVFTRGARIASDWAVSTTLLWEQEAANPSFAVFSFGYYFHFSPHFERFCYLTFGCARVFSPFALFVVVLSQHLEEEFSGFLLDLFCLYNFSLGPKPQQFC